MGFKFQLKGLSNIQRKKRLKCYPANTGEISLTQVVGQVTTNIVENPQDQELLEGHAPK